VLSVGDKSAVAVACVDGSGGNKAGHGHNFHVLEATGDVVKVVKGGGGFFVCGSGGASRRAVRGVTHEVGIYLFISSLLFTTP